MAGGFTAAVIQFGAKAHAAGRTADVARLLSQAQGFRLLVVMPVLTLLVLLVADVSTQALAVAVVFGVVLPAALDGTVACLTIENKTAQAAQIVLIISLATQVAVTVVAIGTGNPDAIWLSRLVVMGVGLLLCLLPISPAYRRAVLQPGLFRAMPPGFWRFAHPRRARGRRGWLGDVPQRDLRPQLARRPRDSRRLRARVRPRVPHLRARAGLHRPAGPGHLRVARGGGVRRSPRVPPRHPRRRDGRWSHRRRRCRATRGARARPLRRGVRRRRTALHRPQSGRRPRPRRHPCDGFRRGPALGRRVATGKPRGSGPRRRAGARTRAPDRCLGRRHRQCLGCPAQPRPARPHRDPAARAAPPSPATRLGSHLVGPGRRTRVGPRRLEPGGQRLGACRLRRTRRACSSTSPACACCASA